MRNTAGGSDRFIDKTIKQNSRQDAKKNQKNIISRKDAKAQRKKQGKMNGRKRPEASLGTAEISGGVNRTLYFIMQ
jgi:hypothetical protein